MSSKPTDADSYILFQLAGTTYALRTAEVQHMEMVEHITPVPNAPVFVEGVILSRGQVVPASNLRVRLIVDSAREFRSIERESIQPPNEAIAGMSGRYLIGIANLADRLILVLDINEVLRFSEEIPAGATNTLEPAL
jgi:purine-binding chemotaxis protein CheW